MKAFLDRLEQSLTTRGLRRGPPPPPDSGSVPMFARGRCRSWAVLVAALLCWSPFAAEAQDAPAAPSTGAIELPPVSVYDGRYVVPLAVPNTYDLSAEGGLDVEIDSIVRNCLQISGFFDVYGPDRYFFDAGQEGMTVASIRFENWYNVGAQGLVKTAYRVAGNQVALDFRLYDIDNQTQLEIPYTGGTVSREAVAGEVYAFVNAIIEYYTGSPGIFGTRIAFVAGGNGGDKHIYTISMDGTGMSQETTRGGLNILPSFGPGGRLMYTSFRAGNPDLYIGSDPGAVSLSARPGFNSGARLSPAGGEIAATLSVGGNADIYILDTNGEILRQCTDNNAEDVSPTWSPDGSQIAFVSDRSGGPQIYVMNADCSGQRRVTFAGNYNTEPDWSPTSNLIAFTGRDERARFDVFTVEPETGFITRLTQDQGDNKSPSWSPDGRYVVVSSTRGGSSGSLYVIDSTGYFQHNITPNGGGFETPRWER